MSRHGLADEGDCDDPLIYGRWRAQVASAIRGKRGQAFLKEALAALDALPEKRLIGDELIGPATGMPFAEHTCNVCLLGAVGLARQMPNLHDLDPEDIETVAGRFGLVEQLARELVWVNDEGPYNETPEDRFIRVRKWVVKRIRPEAET